MQVVALKRSFYRTAPSDPCFVQFQIFITQESLLLDPIGLVFILVFGGILIIQFIAMFFHRFSTLSHMLSTTTINLCQRGVQVRTVLSTIAYLR
jgi:chitin synthase